MADVVGTSELSARFAAFVVVSDLNSGPELEARIGIAGDTVETRGERYTQAGKDLTRRESVWLVRSIGNALTGEPLSPNAPIEHHLQLLFDGIAPAVNRLRSLHSEGARMLLRIVQHIGIDDPQGSGIPIGHAWTILLGELEAEIDIDQYLVN